jgi:membrane protease YdiL (CAAX protease family)
MSRIEGRSFLSYGYLDARKLARFCWGALVGFVALCALVGILALCHVIVFEGRALSGPSILGYGAAWAFTFVLVGIAEESTLRGYVLFTLSRGLNFFWASIILSALFGLIHAGNPGETPVGLAAAAFIGLVFCFSIWLTGSLYWAIGIHAAWDWAQSYFFGVADSGLRIGGAPLRDARERQSVSERRLDGARRQRFLFPRDDRGCSRPLPCMGTPSRSPEQTLSLVVANGYRVSTERRPEISYAFVPNSSHLQRGSDDRRTCRRTNHHHDDHRCRRPSQPVLRIMAERHVCFQTVIASRTPSPRQRRRPSSNIKAVSCSTFAERSRPCKGIS